MKFAVAATALALCASSAYAVTGDVITVHSGDEKVHLKEVQARNGKFFIRSDGPLKPTTSCDAQPKKDCPKPTGTTVFDIVGDEALLSVDVPGGQIAFINSAEGFEYSAPHDSVLPKGSSTKGFSLGGTPSKHSGVALNIDTTVDGHEAKGWQACPEGHDKLYQVLPIFDGKKIKGCTEVGLSFFKTKGPGAFQYDSRVH